ncbi:serine hydrolase [Streptomyces sp. ISL-10]|uniref:serine hydrolase n=1 Tax=Streptomyces sp. ISL-10 TaxID=2819172 RepID=UPI001BE784D4|nr:serine hydrolase domain-containing protein [Streptomyces sp. ISL-10]MBT2368104.1 serine hydrolase [Streptomyces sp. ISL-10]
MRAEHGHDPDSYVEIGSFTKALTGTLLARLATAGRIDPDDHLIRWLPAVPVRSDITLRQLGVFMQCNNTTVVAAPRPRESRRRGGRA